MLCYMLRYIIVCIYSIVSYIVVCIVVFKTMVLYRVTL